MYFNSGYSTIILRLHIKISNSAIPYCRFSAKHVPPLFPPNHVSVYEVAAKLGNKPLFPPNHLRHLLDIYLKFSRSPQPKQNRWREKMEKRALVPSTGHLGLTRFKTHVGRGAMTFGDCAMYFVFLEFHVPMCHLLSPRGRGT